MDTTLPDTGTDTRKPTELNLEQALQTYPHWNINSSVPPVVVEQFDSGLTNKCYLVKVANQTCVLRLNATNTRAMGLDRVNEQVVLGHAERAEIGARIIYCSPLEGLLVTRYIEGRHWSEEEAKTELNIERLVQLLRRTHALPGIGKKFIPADVVQSYLRGIQQQSVVIPERFSALHAKMDQVIYEYGRTSGERRLCHNDPVPANIIDNGEQLFLLDWEYSAMGDPLFDLAVVVHNLKFNEEQMQQLLESYIGRIDNAIRRRFLINYATYIYVDMLWYWFQSSSATGSGYGTIAEGKLDTLVAILHELGLY